MPPIGFTATLNLAKFGPNARGWDADVNANWEAVDAFAVASKAAGWITSGVFDAARIPLATALLAGAVLPGTNLSYNTGTGALSLSGANVAAALGYTPVDPALIGQANGIASLDANGKLPTAQLPPQALTNVVVVADDTERFALVNPDDIQPGDAVKVTATGKTYILKDADPSLAGSYIQIEDSNYVVSVNGQSGNTILLTTDDISDAAATNKYFTNALAQAAINKAHVESVLTGEITSHTHDTNYLKLSGGTLTNFLTLHADPTSALHAASKGYVDTADALKLNLSGGTMTGFITLSADPSLALHAASKQYVDNQVATRLALSGGNLSGDVTVLTGAKLLLVDAPTQPTHATNKAYVDAQIGASAGVTSFNTRTGGVILTSQDVTDALAFTPANKAGDTFTGAVTVQGAVTAQRAAGTDAAFVGFVTGSVHDHFTALANGKMEWGTGAAARDTFLYRDGVGALRTDGSLQATSFIGSGASLTSLAAAAVTGTLAAANMPVATALDLGAVKGFTNLTINGAGLLSLSGANVNAALGYTAFDAALVGVANGAASLGPDGKVPSNQIPAYAVSEVVSVADQAARLALIDPDDIQVGDFVKQIDTGKTYIYAGTDPSVLANYILVTDTDFVMTVNGQGGTNVVLTTDDIAEDGTPTNKWYTDARVQTYGDTRYLQLAGGTLTGFLLLHADPTLDAHAATKLYVDNAVAGVAATAGVISFNTRTGAITLLDTDVNTALGYTAANAAALDASALTTGEVPDARVATRIRRREQASFMDLLVMGSLQGHEATPVPDYKVNMGGAKSWGKMVISSASLANGESVQIDILKVTATGGTGASIFTTKPVLNGTGTRGDGHLDWTTILAAAADDAAIGDDDAYILKVLDGPVDAEDLRVEFYEAQ